LSSDFLQDDFGFAVGLTTHHSAVGAPGRNQSAGVVTTYYRQLQIENGGYVSNVNGVLAGNVSNQLFGYSLSLQDDKLLVGAPNTSHTGAVFCYQYNNQSSSSSVGTPSSWTPLGSALRGNSQKEMFGAAVAISSSSSSSNSLVAVVGAPGRDSANGGVYTFRYQQTTSDWTNMTAAPLIDSTLFQGGMLGSAVDITQDGSRIIAGSPEWGGVGKALVYDWNATINDWSIVFETAGDAINGSYGASVTFLDAKTFAVGQPGATSSQGVVRVYQQATQGQVGFQQLGPSIKGAASGEAVGAAGTINGRSDGNGSYTILVGTATGNVTQYDFNGTAWTTKANNTLSSDTAGAVTALAISDTPGSTYIVGVASSRTASVFSIA
jgi:hypothetical protein